MFSLFYKIQSLRLKLKMSVKQQYNGKRVLITGTTGFLGKVLLQKFLFSLSCADKIYVLIRGKEGSSLFQRFKKQVISSPCFDRIRNLHKGRFGQFILQKVQPIQGDLLKENLGLSPQNMEELIERCNVIINCAASIDFNARLDNAIDINVRGTLRVLELARKIKNLDIFTHISTCYVNCDQPGLKKEEIYQRSMGAEQELKWLEDKPLNELIASTGKILGKFPNTYTFTKNLCERLLKKRQKGVPLCIVRPAIICTSHSQPFPGWIDSLAAAAALFLFVGVGIVRQIKSNPRQIADLVPVDFVVTFIITATAFNFKKTHLPIYHAGSSDRNPITWWQGARAIQSYWNACDSTSKIAKSKILLTQKPWKLKLEQLKHRIPVEAYLRLSIFLGKQHQKNAQKMIKTIQRGEQTGKIFEFFICNSWIFESRNIDKILNILGPQDRKQFNVEISGIDMKKYLQINCYGIRKFILKEDVESLEKDDSDLLKLHSQDKFFSDMKWALKTDISLRPMTQIKTKILSSSRVLKAIEYQVNKRCQKVGTNPDQVRKILNKEAELIINSLVGEAKIPVLRTMALALHKAFKSLYEKININMEMIDQIRELEKNSKIPIVLLPTHRSYLDFLIVSYVFLVYQLRLPHFVADQALLQAHILPYIFRSCGAFFFKKTDYSSSTLYRIIFDKYLELLLREGNTLQFFVEGTRSRTGKILAPRFQILSVVLDAIIYNKIPDAYLIPITINYEKVLQGDTFPGELLGEEMLAETFGRVIKALPRIRISHGRVYIQICKPFMPKQIITDIKTEFGGHQSPEFRKKLVKIVGSQIINRMTNGIVIMSTAIVSGVLLMNRKGISEDTLIKMVHEIVKYILMKGHKVGGVNENSSAVAVRNAIGYLDGIITKTKKNIFELTISAGGQFQKLLMLAYYRSTMTHAFLPQAFVGCAIASFGEQLNANQGIPLSRIHQQTVFLMSLLREEYFIPYSLQSYGDFMKVVSILQDNSVVQIKGEDKVIISPSGSRMIAFYCSLLRSQIECYWACFVYIQTVARNEDRRYDCASLNKFYDTVQWFMESLYDQKIIEYYEACSLQTIKNAFEKYQKEKFVRLVAGGKKKQSVVQVLLPIEQLQGFQNKIKFFRKSSYNSFLSPTDVAKNSLKEVIVAPKL